ncbi:P-loop containing nucleoside triphosphate hydrolase protein, partial [Ramicandelaber brevisporus]
FEREHSEGDLRFRLARLRVWAESIAFYGGEGHERRGLVDSLRIVLEYQRRIAWQNLALSMCTDTMAYVASILSFIAIARPIFNGTYDGKSGADLSALISRNSFVSLYLIYRFTLFAEQAVRMSDVAGLTVRISEMLDALDATELDSDRRSASMDSLAGAASDSIQLDSVAVASPGDARLLVRGLSLVVKRGEHLLVRGQNGAGKTSLVRVLCGLWRPVSGTVHLPRDTLGHSQVFFLPQQPYLTFGTLRDQLRFPFEWSGRHIDPADDELRSTLSLVGLERLAVHLDHEFGQSFDHQEWIQMLSPGEQQRLSIARLLLWKPAFAVLDEATSALDEEAALHLYTAILERGITVVSVAHQSNLTRFHHRILTLRRSDADDHTSYTLADGPAAQL